MNFNCFGNAFVTVFNIGLLNGWYLLMTNTVRLKKQEGVVWYFFSYVYFVVFLLGSTLIASVASVMDKHAKAMVRDIASANRSVIERYALLSRRQRLRNWFKRLKKNTVDSGIALTQAPGQTMKLKREAVLDGYEDKAMESVISRLRRERIDHSLYLLSRNNLIRRGLRYLVESIFFQLVITFAVLISVIGVLEPGISTELLGPLNEADFIVAIFLTEMGLLWLVYGTYGSTDAYFNQPLYLIYFFVNIAMVYARYTNTDELNQLRLFRMLKIPNLMLFLTDSNTLRLFFVVLFEAIPSIISVVNLSLSIVFLSAVVGVQLYTGVFHHCSYPGYPALRNKATTDPIHFPSGCSGNGVGYDTNGTVINNMYWQPRLDNFDSIFTACKSMLRVVMSNEWQGILFSALDVAGLGIQPKTNYHRASGGGSFIFLFILSTLGITLGALYVSVFYYHYAITCILTGRKKYDRETGCNVGRV